MKHCKFCGEVNHLERLKLPRIKRFYVCPECKKVFAHIPRKCSSSTYSGYVEKVEKDYSIPRGIVDILHVLPLRNKNGAFTFKMKSGATTRTISYSRRTDRYFNYLTKYPKSNLTTSIIFQVFIFAFLQLGLCIISIFPHGANTILFYEISALALSVLLGPICLDTGITRLPRQLINRITIKIARFIWRSYDYVCKNVSGALFLFAHLPLGILMIVTEITVFLLYIVSVVIVSLLHALFCFIPIYYIDYKRRHS